MPDRIPEILARGPLAATLCVLLMSAAPAVAGPASGANYVDPPRTGLTHADQWVVEVGPVVHYVLRSTLNGGAESAPAYGLDLRFSRGLPRSGNEVGLRLRPLLLDGAFGMVVAAGYRLHAGRERWKSHLELEVAVPWLGGLQVGLRLGGGLLRELGSSFAWLLGAGVGGGVGRAIVGWIEIRTALQYRF